MQVRPSDIPDVLIVEPKVFADERGFFFESYRREHFRAAGIDCDFVQDNHARSVKNTLRGLHYQREPGQAKLIRVTRGTIVDVAADIRPGSATFGQWVAIELSAENFRMLFVPVGFAHGYAVLSDVAEVQYKCSHHYLPEQEASVAWNDPDIGVAWPLTDPILSERDQNAPSLREAVPTAFA
jgi:dTDP-4-dehydrorhamnose 3,5-epimerase